MIQILEYVLLIRFIGNKKTKIGDFFPPLDTEQAKKPRKQRKKLTDEFPSTVYTDPECLAIIKKRDKQANAPYVKQLEKELKEKLKDI